jgi:drug/metabolite transporter (DMT)-like permease
MFGSFLLGFVGWLAQLAGAFFGLVGIVMSVNHQDGSGIAYGIAVVLIIAGSYAKYVSRQSVRVRGTPAK